MIKCLGTRLKARKGKYIMTTNEIFFLVLVVCAFLLFGGALGWASWMESCTHSKESQMSAQHNQTVHHARRAGFGSRRKQILGTLAAFLLLPLSTPIPATLTSTIRSSVHWAWARSFILSSGWPRIANSDNEHFAGDPRTPRRSRLQAERGFRRDVVSARLRGKLGAQRDERAALAFHDRHRQGDPGRNLRPSQGLDVATPHNHVAPRSFSRHTGRARLPYILQCPQPGGDFDSLERSMDERGREPWQPRI